MYRLFSRILHNYKLLYNKILKILKVLIILLLR
nr:MAG TPA: hypothetical protein [Bacteriophage sp.]